MHSLSMPPKQEAHLPPPLPPKRSLASTVLRPCLDAHSVPRHRPTLASTLPRTCLNNAQTLPRHQQLDSTVPRHCLDSAPHLPQHQHIASTLHRHCLDRAPHLPHHIRCSINTSVVLPAHHPTSLQNTRFPRPFFTTYVFHRHNNPARSHGRCRSTR